MFHSVALLRTIAQEGSLSDSSEGLFQRDKQGARIYRSFLLGKKEKLAVRHKRLLLNHQKNPQISQVNDFRAFLCMGRYECLC